MTRPTCSVCGIATREPIAPSAEQRERWNLAGWVERVCASCATAYERRAERRAREREREEEPA